MCESLSSDFGAAAPISRKEWGDFEQNRRPQGSLRSLIHMVTPSRYLPGENFSFVLWYKRPRRQAYCNGRVPTSRCRPEGVELCITNPSSQTHQLPRSAFPWSEC